MVFYLEGFLLLLTALEVLGSHFIVQQRGGSTRKLQQTQPTDSQCYKGSPKILDGYPFEVTLRNPVDPDEPNVNVLCGGVLIDPFTILTSAGCIWQEVVTGVPFNLAMQNPVNNTFDIEFKAAIAPYCSQGDGRELVDLYGYQLMDDYDGWPDHGNAAGIIKIGSPGSSVPQSEIPALRNDPLPEGSKLTMIGHGAQTNAQAALQDLQTPYPRKMVDYITIPDWECERLILQQFEDKVLDPSTESCAVVNGDFDVGVCNGDDGSALLDADGNIAGVLTWWTVNRCEVRKDNTMPIVFTDVSKQKVKDFIYNSRDKPLTIPLNITDGCGDGQFWDAAPFAVSLQLPWLPNRDSYHHVCNAILIDNGKRILTAAQCIWNDFFPIPIGGSVMYDTRMPGMPYDGDFMFSDFQAALAPRCRNLNSNYDRKIIKSYHIHPMYNGNPNDGYDIAILDLDSAFPAQFSFDSLGNQLEKKINVRDFEQATFYGWGSSFKQESRVDEKGSFNNYSPGKEVPMKLISVNKCLQTLLLENTRNTVFSEIEFCALLAFQGDEFVDLCMYDVGGPLMGQSESGEPMLLGLLTKQQDRRCMGGRDFPKVFTEIDEMKDFIQGVLGYDMPIVARSGDIY